MNGSADEREPVASAEAERVDRVQARDVRDRPGVADEHDGVAWRRLFEATADRHLLVVDVARRACVEARGVCDVRAAEGDRDDGDRG